MEHFLYNQRYFDFVDKMAKFVNINSYKYNSENFNIIKEFDIFFSLFVLTNFMSNDIIFNCRDNLVKYYKHELTRNEEVHLELEFAECTNNIDDFIVLSNLRVKVETLEMNFGSLDKLINLFDTSKEFSRFIEYYLVDKAVPRVWEVLLGLGYFHIEIKNKQVINALIELKLMKNYFDNFSYRTLLKVISQKSGESEYLVHTVIISEFNQWFNS